VPTPTVTVVGQHGQPLIIDATDFRPGVHVRWQERPAPEPSSAPPAPASPVVPARPTPAPPPPKPAPKPAPPPKRPLMGKKKKRR
jgi:hypothetical protein